MCGSCGKLEFSDQSPKSYQKKGKSRQFNKVPRVDQILLGEERDTTSVDVSTLLKLSPGTSTLQQAIVTLSDPISKKSMESGIVVDFKSFTPDRPHRLLIDPIYQDIKFMAVYNDHNSFDLNNLSNAYGECQFADYIQNHKFWFFKGFGVAFATHQIADQKVEYVQFFENRIDFDRYIELQCLFEETFA